MKKFILTLPLFLLLFACQNEDNATPIEEPFLLPVSHEVLLFQYTPDTGNNTSRLQYKIKFTNPNPIAVKGFHKVTLNSDGLVASTLGSSNSPCFNIGANGNCTLEYDAQDSHALGMIQSVELVSVEYLLEEQ